MTGEIIAHSQDQTDQKQTDRDRTRTELVQGIVLNAWGSLHPDLYLQLFCMAGARGDTCDLCGRSP